MCCHAVRHTTLACAIVLSLVSSQSPAQMDSVERVNSWPGKIDLPGTAHRVELYSPERKGEKLGVTVVFPLGLREQAFPMKGTIDDKGKVMLKLDEPDKGLVVHPHCPILALLKIEGTWTKEAFTGTAYVRTRKAGAEEYFRHPDGLPCRIEFKLFPPRIP